MANLVGFRHLQFGNIFLVSFKKQVSANNLVSGVNGEIGNDKYERVSEKAYFSSGGVHNSGNSREKQYNAGMAL